MVIDAKVMGEIDGDAKMTWDVCRLEFHVSNFLQLPALPASGECPPSLQEFVVVVVAIDPM